MKFIKELTSILVNDEFEIKTVQYFDEDEDRVILRIAEYVPEFQRGYVCDMQFAFSLIDKEALSINDEHLSRANDLVLVHIRKTSDMDSFPQFEYVFYKS